MGKNIFMLFIVVLYFVAINTANAQKTELEGTWIGYEIGREGDWTFIVQNNHCEVYGANSYEWYKGSFELDTSTNPKRFNIHIEECPMPSYVGIDALAIYKIEGDTITYAGEEPGSGSYPIAFTTGDPDGKGYNTRVFVGVRQQGNSVMGGFFEPCTIKILPNPAVELVSIEYKLDAPGHIGLAVYDCLGKQIKQLADSYVNEGMHRIIFDTDLIQSGVYFIILKTGQYTISEKLEIK